MIACIRFLDESYIEFREVERATYNTKTRTMTFQTMDGSFFSLGAAAHVGILVNGQEVNQFDVAATVQSDAEKKS